MKVWYDACTGKHVRYGTAIARRLREAGHEILLTTRDHPDTIPLANHLGERFQVYGEYAPGSLSTRLRASIARTGQLCGFAEENSPDLAVNSQSPELCRVAFGLGIPIVTTMDTPYAQAVGKLTLPFTDVLLISNTLYGKYPSGIPFVQEYQGVDEVAWVRGFEPEHHDIQHPFILVREMENASYSLGREDNISDLLQGLVEVANILILKRDGERLYYPRGEGEPILWKGFIDAASLAEEADLVVGSGGTICREAALQGTPAVVLQNWRIDVNLYLSSLGFPIYTVKTPEEVLKVVRKRLGVRPRVRELFERLENPVDIIEGRCEEWAALCG